MKGINRQLGQSVSEFLITMAVLVPLLLTLASFLNLLNLSTETVEASRLAAWERTVYKANSEYGFTTTDALNKIEDNINDIYLSRNYTDYGPDKAFNTGTLPSIVDRTVNGGQPVTVRVPDDTISGTGMATESTRLARQLGFVQGGGTNAALLSPEVSIALNEDYSLFKAFNFKNYRKFEYTDPTAPDDPIAGRPQFNLSGYTALIASSLYTTDPEELATRTGNAAFDGAYNSDENSGGLGRFENGVLRSFELAKFGETGMVLDVEGGYGTSSGLETVLPSDLDP